MEREERSEYVTIRVTPKVKRELELTDTNENLKLKIIRDHIASETSWLKDEMKEIDDIVIRYTAKLLTIKDKFEEVQDIYIKEIEGMYSLIDKKSSNLGEMLSSSSKTLDSLNFKVKDVSEKLANINIYKLQNLMELLERFQRFTDEDKSNLLYMLSKVPKVE